MLREGGYWYFALGFVLICFVWYMINGRSSMFGLLLLLCCGSVADAAGTWVLTADTGSPLMPSTAYSLAYAGGGIHKIWNGWRHTRNEAHRWEQATPGAFTDSFGGTLVDYGDYWFGACQVFRGQLSGERYAPGSYTAAPAQVFGVLEVDTINVKYVKGDDHATVWRSEGSSVDLYLDQQNHFASDSLGSDNVAAEITCLGGGTFHVSTSSYGLSVTLDGPSSGTGTGVTTQPTTQPVASTRPADKAAWVKQAGDALIKDDEDEAKKGIWNQLIAKQAAGELGFEGKMLLLSTLLEDVEPSTDPAEDMKALCIELGGESTFGEIPNTGGDSTFQGAARTWWSGLVIGAGNVYGSTGDHPGLLVRLVEGLESATEAYPLFFAFTRTCATGIVLLETVLALLDWVCWAFSIDIGAVIAVLAFWRSGPGAVEVVIDSESSGAGEDFTPDDGEYYGAAGLSQDIARGPLGGGEDDDVGEYLGSRDGGAVRAGHSDDELMEVD